MTIDEAIARIREHKIVHKMNEPRAIYISEALDMAIKALEWQKMMTNLRIDCSGQADSKAQTKWIPCNERLPKDGDSYLVTIEYKGYAIGVDVATYSPVEGYIDNHWETFNDWIEDDDSLYHITAWMSLPEPYKVESEDKG